MRSPRSQLAVAIVALLLGFLAVVQLRTQSGGTGLERQSSQDLTLLIANLNTRNDQLRGEVSNLQRQIDAIAATGARGETSVGQLRSDLERIRIWAGLDPATGPGIRVTLAGDLSAGAVSDLLNELRNAGAEALALGGVRVAAGTVVGGPAGGLSVENTALGPRFEVLAIGNPAALTGSLTRAGGIVAQIRATYQDVAVEVTPLDVVAVPATERTLVPAFGEPRP
jgi:uncharacterized protein YlxW (UPF0749 family)